VYIDDLNGGAAVDIELHSARESPLAPGAADVGGTDRFQPVDPAVASRRTLSALWRTDDRPGLRVSQRYSDLRQLALTRACRGPRTRNVRSRA
jgi:hypothetical protein